jgi:hypothetical protein
LKVLPVPFRTAGLAVAAILAAASTVSAAEERPWCSLDEAVRSAMAPAPAHEAPGARVVEVSLFLHAADIGGAIEAGGRRADFDASFGDVLDLLNLGGGVRLDFRGEGPVGFFAVGELYDLRSERDVLARELEVGLVQSFASAGITWRVLGGPRADGSASPLDLRLLGGVRYGYAALSLDLDPGFDETWHKDWIDGLAGFRAVWNASRSWGARLHADASGFGIGSSSELTSDVTALVEWRAKNGLRLGLGYRVLYFVYREHDGLAENSIRQVNSGPYVELTFAF